MRYRSACVEDIAACIALLREDGGFRANEAVWEALPMLWQTHLENNDFAAFQVFETTTGRNSRIVAFRISAFVTDAFCDQYASSPYAQVAADVWQRELNGSNPLLNRAEIGVANACGELNMVVLHWTVRHRNPAHPETIRVLTLVASAWHSAHLGYRLKRLSMYEVFGKAAACVMKNIGYQKYQLTGVNPTMCNVQDSGDSHVFYWSSENVNPGSGAMIAIAHLNCPAPRFSFSPAQQRVILGALDGKTDKAISETLGIRYDTVRQTWDAIYRRVEVVDSDVLVQFYEGERVRGAERRRVLVEYIRQHLEEVRPYDRRAVSQDEGSKT